MLILFHLLCKLRDSLETVLLILFQCFRSTAKYSDCVHKKRFCLESIESKLDNGLDRALNAVFGWVRIFLQNEQKKTDFKPETDIDTVASSVSLVLKVFLQNKLMIILSRLAYPLCNTSIH